MRVCPPQSSRARRRRHCLACGAATSALPRLWGQRARALLVALIQYPDDNVTMAAIVALDELNAIDEHVVRKLDLILGRITTKDALRAVATTALAHAQH
jgi:hypothetical protein